MIRLIIYCLLLAIVSCKDTTHEATDLTVDLPSVTKIQAPKTITAGTTLYIRFESNDMIDSPLTLLLKNSWTTTHISAKKEDSVYVFIVPSFISAKAGTLSYTLLYKNKTVLNDVVTILPNTATKSIETYFGPQFLVAGKKDFAHLVSIPTDAYDNPNYNEFTTYLLDQNTEYTMNVSPSKLIHWQTIFSKPKVGKLYSINRTDTITSKQHVATIIPAPAEDFSISENHNHLFADGKELITLQTSEIKDEFQNIIANGSLVTFIIKNGKSILKANATTINGVATTRFLHPDKPTTYTISAIIAGIANSNEIAIKFEEKPNGLE